MQPLEPYLVKMAYSSFLNPYNDFQRAIVLDFPNFKEAFLFPPSGRPIPSLHCSLPIELPPLVTQAFQAL